MIDTVVPTDSSDDRAVATLDRIIYTLDCIAETLLEAKYARRAPGDFSPIARRLFVIEFWRLADMLDDAVDDGRLTEDERSSILLTDLVLLGQRRTDSHEVYLLAEIDENIALDDVERAADRAALLEKLGRPVIPVVAGRRINCEAVERAYQLGVWHALDGQVIASPPA